MSEEQKKKQEGATHLQQRPDPSGLVAAPPPVSDSAPHSRAAGQPVGRETPAARTGFWTERSGFLTVMLEGLSECSQHPLPTSVGEPKITIAE